MSVRFLFAKLVDAVFVVAFGLGFLAYASDSRADIPVKQPKGGPLAISCALCVTVGQSCSPAIANGCWHTNDHAWSPCTCCNCGSNGDGGADCGYNALISSCTC